MRKNNTIEIYGETFTVKHAISKLQYVSCLTLENCYQTPSIYKRRIWEYWFTWFVNQRNYMFGVRSYNGFMFTIEGIVHDNKNDIHGLVYITKTRQEFYPFAQKF